MRFRRIGRQSLLLAATGLAFASAGGASAQAPEADILDPGTPLDPLPDLDVDWPDLNQPDPVPEGTDQPAMEQSIQAATAVDYRVIVSGVSDEELLRRFRGMSALEAGRGEGGNPAQIDRRAREDSTLLTDLLRSDGYYDAKVDPSTRQAGIEVEVTLEVAPGPLYRFETVSLPGLEGAGEDSAALRESFAVKAGDPVDATKVEAAGLALKVALGERGFANASVGEQDIEIDHEARVARLVLPVDPGAYQRFGRLIVTGKPPFGARHVGRIARFDPGDRFRQSEVDDLRRALVATGLVSTVETRVIPNPDGRTVDVAVKLSPAPMRTVAGALGYGTGEGVRAEASWQHRNFFNPEGALTLRAVAGTQEQLAAASLRRNNWRARDRVLTASVSASNVDRDAYSARTFHVAAGMERQSNFIWQKKWTWSIGAELLASNERDRSSNDDQRRAFFIGALPLALTYDGSDSLLDPTRGFRLGGRISPEISLQSGTFVYSRVQFDGSAYRPVSSRVVAAGRVRLGTIAGATRDAIAPSRRFYSGGGGSVRGYGYQRLGPLDDDGNPIGGRSVAELALEARIRFGSFGIVPFVDAGSLSIDSLPDLSGFRIGAGIGVRYYSSFGPIRVDVGTPLKRREDDSRIAVTVSLGQAF